MRFRRLFAQHLLTAIALITILFCLGQSDTSADAPDTPSGCDVPLDCDCGHSRILSPELTETRIGAVWLGPTGTESWARGGRVQDTLNMLRGVI